MSNDACFVAFLPSAYAKMESSAVVAIAAVEACPDEDLTVCVRQGEGPIMCSLPEVRKLV